MLNGAIRQGPLKAFGVVRLDCFAFGACWHCGHAKAYRLEARVVSLQCSGKVQRKKAADVAWKVSGTQYVSNQLIVFTGHSLSLTKYTPIIPR